MKIIHVETGRHLYGGAQQVLYLMRGLAGRGIDGLLVCMADSGIDRAARAWGLRVCNVPCAGDLDLRFAWRLRQLLEKETADLVHCHSRRGADFLGGQAAAMAGIPAIVSRRVDNPETAMGAALRYRKFRKVIAISESIGQVLRAAGVDASRIEIIRSAVDTAAIEQATDPASFRREFGIRDGDVVIAAAGQLIARKGHRHLLEALARLVTTRPQLRLIVFGEGPLRAELLQLTSRLQLEQQVTFAGFRDDLDAMLGNVDLLVHPALAEGLGVAVLKAAAAAVPVVAFAAGGVREAVSDGETGLLVPPADVEALAAAMESLIDDPERRARLGAAGRKRMQTEFTIDVMVEKHTALYEALLRD
ncbi:MAG: glycosyltransferase [Gammaproteobacteria bacterium]|nr:glycosyltransferase [Gammaproteobacteria bacterium]